MFAPMSAVLPPPHRAPRPVASFQTRMRRLPAVLVAIGLALAAQPASALEIEPFSADALARARRSEAPVALHFHSKWCGTCRMQARAFDAMRAEQGLGLALLVVDFDEDRATSRAFHVSVPGVVVVLRGETERARAIGVTDPEQLRAVLRKAF